MKKEQVAEHDNLVVEAYAAVMVRINTDVRLSKLKGQGLQDSYALYSILRSQILILVSL